ncbi:MAG: hypothetical protein EON55_23020 [Alphaproteobacteria bacterium]|nr:MAG: hypothetical protein EON55_23020 [Alphaproteobacteria bacterium]
MSYAILPALRVKNAAEKALSDAAASGDGIEPKLWFEGLIGLCRAIMADPKADHDIAVDAADFARIMKHYDFTDPRLIMQHEHQSTMRSFGRE